ncbi:MAG: FkbM family methyltransferase [Zoogloeaceae bacterium]|jgi:FkbM family methyltransferase|nr:FkbM family methyltransferase [Zoogloeaceae bacterium]
MSVYATARIQQLMGCVINQAVLPLVENSEVVEKVTKWLEDEASREQYERELVFMVLSGRIGGDNAIRYAGNVPLDEWAGALKKVETMLASGELPALAYPDNDNYVIRDSGYASLFILNQYQHSPFVMLREGDVFLDCGACCGDSAIWALSKGAGKVYSFEPDPEAIGYLRRNIARYGQGRTDIVMMGLGAESGSMALSVKPGHIGSTRLIDAGEGVTVPVVALDDWLRENKVKPDFIKMDLEGSEVAALRGAQAAIVEYKPRLAICLYHRLSDMWVIPAMLKAMVPEYRFWCRKSHPVWEFVLYASI